MLKIHKNYSLKNNNSFGINIVSSYYTEPGTAEEIIFALEYARERNWDFYITGEGSNLLFTDNYKGFIIHPVLNRISKTDESETEILVNAQAGVNWTGLYPIASPTTGLVLRTYL